MPRVGSAAAVGATIRDSRRHKKNVSQGQDEAKSGSVTRTGGGRASATKRLSSLQDGASSRPSSCHFASDSPDLPEVLLPGGATGGGGSGGVNNTATGVTPDLRAFPTPTQAPIPGSSTPPSLALSPPTPNKLSVTPNSDAGRSTNASVEGCDGGCGGGSVSPGSGSVGSVDCDDAEAEAYLEKPKVEIKVDMSATGDWNGWSALEKPRDCVYDRPPKGWKTSLAKTFGFFFFFALNAFLISYLVPLLFKAMLGL